MREVSLEGARLICETVTSMCYQLDEETMVVLDITPEPLAQIEHEKQNARETLVLGLPALFSFEMVRCGERYGVIYEHLQAKTLGQQIMGDPAGFDHYLDLFTALSRRIHATSVSPAKFRSMKDDYADKIERLGDRITAEEAAAALRLVNAIPDRDTYVEIGFQPSRIFFQDDSLLMNYFAFNGYGHPIFDLANTCASTLFSAATPKVPDDYICLVTNLDRATALRFWDAYLHRYFDLPSEGDYEEMNGLLRHFGQLTLLFSVLTMPHVADEKVGFDPIQLCRRTFFPHVDEWVGKLDRLLPAFD